MTDAVNQTHSHKVDNTHRRLTTWLREGVPQLLWPGRCLVCTARGTRGLDLCAACLAELPWHRHACLCCALPLPATTPEPGPPGVLPGPSICGPCLAQPSPVTQTHSACTYHAPLDRLLPRFKFHRDLAAGRLLAQVMAQAFAHLPPPVALVPIPLHHARLRQRGYDQALELARPLGRMLGIPVWGDSLMRQRATAPQSRLDAADRQRNLRDAFAVRPGTRLPAHVALVDDVMTTGATLHAAATALRRAGVTRVDAWVAARVP
ncbi:double zinc ribbon domain-containing protein [Lysobacter sp. A378]